MSDCNHRNSGFLRGANESGTRHLGGDIAVDGIQARFHSSHILLSIVTRPGDDESLSNLTERSDKPVFFLTTHHKHQRSEVVVPSPIH